MPGEVVGEPIELWSDAMHEIVARHARSLQGPRFMEYDDLYQEGCLAVVEYERRRGSGPIAAAYLARMARNRMRKGLGYRRRRANVRPREQLPLDGPLAESLQAAPVEIEAVLDVAEAIDRAPEKHRRTLWALFREFRTVSEAAELQGKTQSAVYGQAKRAYAHMREALAAGYGEEEWRPRATRPKHRYVQPGREVDWSKWGRIPGQRKDD